MTDLCFSHPLSAPNCFLMQLCVLLGYSHEHKTYRYYDPMVQRFHLSYHLTFCEDIPYYFSSFQNLSFLRQSATYSLAPACSPQVIIPDALIFTILPGESAPPRGPESYTESLSQEFESADAYGDSSTSLSTPYSPMDIPAPPTCRYPDREQHPLDRFAFFSSHTYTES